MKESYTTNNAGDFEQRYLGTYGRFTKSNGEKITVCVDELTGYEVRCSTVDGVSLTARIDSGVEFEFYPLNRRVSDYQGQIIYSERKAERQWRRGIHHGNTKIVNLCRGKDIRVDHKIVDAIYNSPQVPYDTFRECMGGKRNNFLLSDKFSVVDETVYIYDKNVGTFNKGKQALSVSNLFLQEVKDAVLRNKVPLTVSTNEHV